MKGQTSIFISHAWGGESDEVLAQLVKRLESEDIKFILDKRDLSYRQSIRDFMVKLGESDMVIIILSNKYLKSEYCMFELLEIHKNENITDRIFPIVLEEVKISSSADRLDFVKYWETQLIDLQNKVKELNSLSYIEGITDDLNLYSEIRNNIARLTGILRDINTLNIKLHRDSDYTDLVTAIKQRIPGFTQGKLAKEKLEQDKLDEDKRAEEHLNEEKLALEKLAEEKLAKQKHHQEKLAELKQKREKLAQEMLAQEQLAQHQLDEERKTPAYVAKPDSTPLLNSTNLKRSGIVLFVIGGLFVVWKFLIQPKTYDTDETQDLSGVQAIDTQAILNQAIFNAVMRDSIDLNGYPTVTFPDETVESNPQQHTTSSKPQTTTAKKQKEPEVKYYEDPQNNSAIKLITIPTTEQQTTNNKPTDQTTEDQPLHFSTSDLDEATKTALGYQSATVFKGTLLVAKSSTTFSSEDMVTLPKRVMFTLDQSVKEGYNTILPKGSLIMAKVTNLKASNNKRAGMIDLVFEYLEAPDGQKIPLQTNEFHLVAKGYVPITITPQTTYKIKTSSTLQIEY